MQEAGEEAVSGGRRVLVAGAIAGGIVAAALGGLWLERQPIVRHFADSTLRARHVPASYRIAAIGPFVQRLEDVRIGDPAHPDLVARSLELHLSYGLHGPHLVSVSGEGVRLAARLVNGRVSLGTIDRLLPPPGNAPFALPDLGVTLHDARIALATPQGTVTLRVAGQGNLADGFSGTVIASAPAVAAGGCRIADLAANMRVTVARREPSLNGPLSFASLDCPSRALALGRGWAATSITLAPALDRWSGTLAPSGFAGRLGQDRFGALGGWLTLSGDARRTTGKLALNLAGVAAPQGQIARVELAGPYRLSPRVGGVIFSGDARLRGLAIAPAMRTRIAASARALGTTPVGPLADRAAGAFARLLAGADAEARVAFTIGGAAGTALRVRALDLAGASGGHMRIDGGEGLGWNANPAGWRVDGRFGMSGGGLPTVHAVLHQPQAGGGLSGEIAMAPYAAGGARLALAPVRFAIDGNGGTRFATVATLDGPLGTARIEGLTVPIAGRIAANGGLRIDEGCAPIRLRGFQSGGIRLAAETLRLCGAQGGAIVARDPGGALRFGATAADLRLTGRSGSSPLTLSAVRAQVSTAGLALDRVAVRLGEPARQTALDVDRLDGRFDAAGVGGGFSGASGHIGAVPLLLSDAGGHWRMAGGVLRLDGGLTVSDAQTASPRFKPLAARDVKLVLAGGRITATGALHEPRSDALVSDVTLHHDLSTGVGDARLAVPGIIFGKALQPEALTPLTLGVIANVAGTLDGEGRIAWSPSGVTSTGDFHTDKLDLAAAFGPVSGIAGTIHFSDLLGLVTPPHQTATIAEVNPGVAVSNGVVHYQLVGQERVRVEDARWPFAGGTLTLDPTLLAFGQDAQRHLTFRVSGLDAAAFVQQLAFPNISATGTFDGVLPMIFDQSGGRIEGGRLTVRPGGGTLAYIGAVSNADLGTMGKIAFDALKAIRYNALTITLDGRLDGEIVSNVRFLGVHQATGDDGFVARTIRGLPFRFNIAIRAPFRGLLGSARAFVDPSLLLKSAQPVDIQPAESETVR